MYRKQSCAECTVVLRLRHSIPFHSECIFGVWHTPFRGVEWMLQHALHSMEWVCLDTLQAHSSIWIFPPSICLQFARTNACISKVTTLTTFYPPILLKRENSNTGMCLECVLTHSLHGMECMLLHTFHSMEWNTQCIHHSWSVPGMECVPLRNGHKTGINIRYLPCIFDIRLKKCIVWCVIHALVYHSLGIYCTPYSQQVRQR